ncbi:HAD family hydrolase [Paenibacillus alkaliterrae]|uniref:HAD family hydrolase n=1 Tax=Paenibacillus alkaliterrae TaxID=320909 RepID=UPI001F3EBF4F|nr:HAD family hydrolase [Paenibacillus alkaliterrae]MCF2938125.1 HAD family hydrolase [Paenibacillus alkaliterrae]
MPHLLIGSNKVEIDGILFDKDGTLLDFVGLWGFWSEVMLRCFNKRLAERGLELPPDIVPALWGTVHDAEGRIVGYDRKGALAMGTVGDMLAIVAWQACRLGLSWAEAMVIARECKEAADAEIERERPARPLPGAVDFLKQCRQIGLPMGIVTADETAAAELHLGWMGIRDLFDIVVGTDQTERGKPFPDMLLLACRELKLQPSRVAVIGDTNGDMVMGKSAGAAISVGLSVSHEGDEGAIPDADVVITTYGQMSIAGQTDEG